MLVSSQLYLMTGLSNHWWERRCLQLLPGLVKVLEVISYFFLCFFFSTGCPSETCHNAQKTRLISQPSSRTAQLNNSSFPGRCTNVWRVDNYDGYTCTQSCGHTGTRLCTRHIYPLLALIQNSCVAENGLAGASAGTNTQYSLPYNSRILLFDCPRLWARVCVCVCVWLIPFHVVLYKA